MMLIVNIFYQLYYSVDNKPNIINVITIIISFLLGLLSSIIIDYVRNKYRNKRLKQFIKSYLKTSILPEIPKLIETYKGVRDYIESDTHEKFKYKCHVSFNNSVLTSIEYSDYYNIFKDKIRILNSIISVVSYISENLPGKEFEDYYKSINNHLISINVTQPRDHLVSCSFCKLKKDITLGNIDLRIIELDELERYIKILLK